LLSAYIFLFFVACLKKDRLRFLFYTSLEGRINGYRNRKFIFDWSKERERLQYIQCSKKVQNNAQEEEAKTNKLMKKSLSYGPGGGGGGGRVTEIFVFFSGVKQKCELIGSKAVDICWVMRTKG